MEALELLAYAGARELLETLQEYRERQFTVNELAKTAKLPFTSAWRLVKKFEMAGIVETTLIGKSRAVKYREGKFSKLIREILLINSSHQQLSLKELKRTLKKKKQIRKAYLFGSVAEKKEKLESDIDVAILVRKRFDVHQIISEMYEKYRAKIVPLTFEDEDEFEDFLKGKKRVKLA